MNENIDNQIYTEMRNQNDGQLLLKKDDGNGKKVERVRN